MILIDVSKKMVVVIIDGVRYIFNLLDNSLDTVSELVSRIIDKEFEND